MGQLSENIDRNSWVDEAHQGFVKFFGEGHDRTSIASSVLVEVRSSGCHWACTYPKGKRPRQVENGALIFMGSLTHSPKDIRIYGRAIGIRHREGRDDATTADIELRPWRKRWPHYIRVHHVEFINGTLEDCVSLGEMMDTLGPNSFGSTQEHLATGTGNTNPRRAYQQQASARLTPESIRWLNDRIDAAFIKHGRISPSDLEQLDWPQDEAELIDTN